MYVHFICVYIMYIHTLNITHPSTHTTLFYIYLQILKIKFHGKTNINFYHRQILNVYAFLFIHVWCKMMIAGAHASFKVYSNIYKNRSEYITYYISNSDLSILFKSFRTANHSQYFLLESKNKYRIEFSDVFQTN